MTDHNDRRIHAIKDLPGVRRDPSRLYVLWASLSDTVKVGLGLLAIVSAIAGGVRGCDAMATGGELAASVATVERKQDAVDTKQNAKIDELDAKADLGFEVQVELKTDMMWVKQELTGVRQDLRRLDRGLPLPALPAPHPTQTPKGTP